MWEIIKNQKIGSLGISELHAQILKMRPRYVNRQTLAPTTHITGVDVFYQYHKIDYDQ